MNHKTQIREWVIYKITSPSGRVYIGKSGNYLKRIKYYKSLSCKPQRLLYKSFLKYGFVNHKIEEIESFKSDLSYVDGKEMFWIRTYMSNGSRYEAQKGLNLTDGGEGALGSTATDETKYKQSIAKKGKPTWNKGLKGVQSAWNKGVKMGESWNKGKKFEGTPEERKYKFGSHNIGNSYNKGRKHSSEIISARVQRQLGKSNSALNKPILQYSLNGVFIKEYESIKLASKEIGFDKDAISKIAKGITKKPQFFIFKFKAA